MKNIIFLLIAISLFTACEDKVDPTSKKNETAEPKPDNTLDSLNTLILNDVNNIDLYLKRSTYFNSVGNTESALSDLSKAQRVDSTNSNIYLQKGNILFTQESFGLAKESYEKCIEYNDTNKYCLLHNARMELLLGNYKNTLEYINKSLKSDVYFNEAYYLKGRYYEEIGDTANAVSSYSTVIENDPNYFDAFLQIAVLYTTIKSDLALEYYSSALEIKPNSVEALQNLGIFYQNTGRADLAIKSYNKAEIIMPNNAMINYNKGFVYLAQKNEIDSAIYEFSQATAKFPEYYQAFYNLGIAYEEKGDLKTALNHFETSLTVKPDFTEAALAKGRMLTLLNQ